MFGGRGGVELNPLIPVSIEEKLVLCCAKLKLSLSC
jgi:hypothetical protein